MHNCTHTMAAYLADWQAKTGLPISYQRWTARYTDPPPFQQQVELYGPVSGTAHDCRVPYKDAAFTVQLVNGRPHIGEPVEVLAGEESILVASVAGRRVMLAFDLERLFEQPGDLQPGLILETVLAATLPKAADFIRTYDHALERVAFAEWLVGSVDRQVAGCKNHIRDNEFEASRLTTQLAALVRKNEELRDQLTALARRPARRRNRRPAMSLPRC